MGKFYHLFYLCSLLGVNLQSGALLVRTEEQVNDVYGDSSFEDALADRQFSLDHMSDIISKVIDK